MNINTAAILRGGALVSWRGASFYHRGNLELPLDRETIDIDDIEPFGVTFRSQDKQSIEPSFTPAGRLSEIGNLINRYATSVKGDLINLEEFPVTINTTTNVLTVPSGNLLSTGNEVMIHWLATQPAGLSRTTRYYWHSASGTTGTLHASAADATNNTNAIDITTTGSGVVLSVARPLVIHARNGLRITYYNAALVNIPSLRFKAGETLLGECGFRIYVRNGADPEDLSAAYYAIDFAAFSDSSFDPADIPRQSPVVTWDNGSPWADGLSTREGAEVAFELNVNPLPNDAFGENVLGESFGKLELTVTSAVQGVTEAEAKAALKIQTGARGDDISGDGPLEIDTAAYNFTIGDAALTSAPQAFGSADQRSGNFVWRAMPVFDLGALNPLYELTQN